VQKKKKNSLARAPNSLLPRSEIAEKKNERESDKRNEKRKIPQCHYLDIPPFPFYPSPCRNGEKRSGTAGEGPPTPPQKKNNRSGTRTSFKREIGNSFDAQMQRVSLQCIYTQIGHHGRVLTGCPGAAWGRERKGSYQRCLVSLHSLKRRVETRSRAHTFMQCRGADTTETKEKLREAAMRRGGESTERNKPTSLTRESHQRPSPRLTRSATSCQKGRKAREEFG